MTRQGSPVPTTTATRKSPLRDSPRRQWIRALIRIAVAFGFFAAAASMIGGVVFRIQPALLLRALTVFFAWPLQVQSLAVVGLLVLIALVAGGIQFYQWRQNLTQQRNIAAGMEPTTSLLARFLEAIAARSEPAAGEPTGASKAPSLAPAPSPFAVRPPHTTRRPHDDAQLTPPDRLIGRDEELRWVEERLKSHQRDQDTTVIYGTTGIGKSALAAVAIENARDVHHLFKDGIALVSCEGMDDPVQVVRHALERVDPSRRFPLTLELDVLRQLSEELLAGKDILILLDGVGATMPLGEVVRALRTRDRSAHILITTTIIPSVNVAPPESQWHLRPLQVVRRPDGSEADQALELFAHYAGKESAGQFGGHLAEACAIVEALERHTYSLQLVGSILQAGDDILPLLATEIEQLKSGRVPREIQTALLPVWVAHTRTVDALPEEARALLFAFGAFGTVEAGRQALHALGERLGLRDTAGAIHLLVQHQLMESFHTATMPEESDRDRLRIHTLLHSYINGRLREPEWQERYERARDIIAAYYAEYVPPLGLPDPTRSIQRALTADAENVAHALDWAVDHHQYAVVATLAHGMRRYWHDRWMNDKTLRYMRTAVDSAALLAREAKAQGEFARAREFRGLEADLAFTLGRVLRRVGSLEEAEPLFVRDLEYRKRRQPPDYAAIAQVLHQFAQLERSRGDMKKALRYCRRGLRVVRRHRHPRFRRARELDDSLAQAKGLLLAQQGRIERSLGNLRKAEELFREALALFEQTGDLLEQGVAWGYRGRIARVLGDLPRAQEYFERSNELARQVYDFRGQGIIATQFGRIARMRGDLDAAEEAFQEGFNKAKQVQDQQAMAVNLNYLGRIALSRRRSLEAKHDFRRSLELEAEHDFRRSLEIARQSGDLLDVGVNLGYLGRIALERGFLDRAWADFGESLSILKKVGDRRGQALILANWARADMKAGHYVWAWLRLRQSLRLIRRVGDIRSEGTVRLFLGQWHFEQGQLAAAQRHFAVALQRAQTVKDRSAMDDAQTWIGKVADAACPAP